MRYASLLLCLTLAAPAFTQSCEPIATTQKILDQLNTPYDAHLPAVQRNQMDLALLRKAIAAAPGDVQLHEAYQDLRLQGLDSNRPALIAEYEQQLAAKPNDPVLLYLTARAQVGQKTKVAIANLQRAAELAPGFGLPHLLLAEIDASAGYPNPADLKVQIERYAALCPASVRSFNTLRWNSDTDLIRAEAVRLRKNISGRTDSLAVAAYNNLWSFEQALENSDHQAENQARMRSDIDRLFGPEFTRNTVWLSTMRTASYMDGAPQGILARANQQIAALYPNSDAAMDVQYDNAIAALIKPQNGTPDELTAYSKAKLKIVLQLLKQWPNSIWLALSAKDLVLEQNVASDEEIKRVMELLLIAFKSDPEGIRLLPPIPVGAAQKIVDRGGPLEIVPELERVGQEANEREFFPNDLYTIDSTMFTSRRALADLWDYLPLAEAELRLGQFPSATLSLDKAETSLKTLSMTKDSLYKASLGIYAAQYWSVRGLLAEKENRKMDALIDYRNAITLYPLREPNNYDRRDEVMDSAERIWKELGGTAHGWSDWASVTSLDNFYGGSGASHAWATLAKSSPDLVINDVLGNHWKPAELETKTTFISVWASWCGGCIRELPYFQKLYERFKGRNDVVFLALNVDDDPRAMNKELERLKVTIPSVAAVDFLYSLLPDIGLLPASWIITSSKTQYFEANSDNMDAWMEEATKAIETASKK